mmetsp:Transcript_25950/g.80959  ORF Transcript_25950/g.80959 Transcript_25950/m.80959 type:complete len:214 (+) Transcript_25950:155-796(+)|eukprot:CAMPEP_0204560890 /NCGR_PEP_ID=MMETSP0661-20131031/32871_1 /ASSEMBLY_ACC=CAM_ASM_000606 /TAXON_ID=109239 /ORGANISM="Alexandrium margalefi, Strain AMGDE01CS-322" /LENGTH=213 /DNA_ID=CAMNT_0051568257 /DNA_START=155 /DNA_END=796 /DNA_ORIENTATION=-
MPRLNGSLDLGQGVRASALQATPTHRPVVFLDCKYVVIGICERALQIDFPLGVGEHPHKTVLDLTEFCVEGAIFEDGHATHPLGAILRRGGPLTDQIPHEVDDDQQQLRPLCDAKLGELLEVIVRDEGLGAQTQAHLMAADTKLLRHDLPKLSHGRAWEATKQRLCFTGKGGYSDVEWLLLCIACLVTSSTGFPHDAATRLLERNLDGQTNTA